VRALIHAPVKSLLELNETITRQVIDWLALPVHLSRTTEFEALHADDPRYTLVDKKAFQQSETCPYIQVFPGEGQYALSLSILDPLFCEGPMARSLLMAGH
jgi:hypothetical protein